MIIPDWNCNSPLRIWDKIHTAQSDIKKFPHLTLPFLLFSSSLPCTLCSHLTGPSAFAQTYSHAQFRSLPLSWDSRFGIPAIWARPHPARTAQPGSRDHFLQHPPWSYCRPGLPPLNPNNSQQGSGHMLAPGYTGRKCHNHTDCVHPTRTVSHACSSLVLSMYRRRRSHPVLSGQGRFLLLEYPTESTGHNAFHTCTLGPRWACR